MSRAVTKIKYEIKEIENDQSVAPDRKKRAAELKERIREIDAEPIRSSAMKTSLGFFSCFLLTVYLL